MTAAIPDPEITGDDRMLAVMDLRLAARWLCPVASAVRPVVVLLHEALGSIGQWKAFPERLATACDVSVLVYERQGHGNSSPLGQPRDPDYLRHEAERTLPAVLAAAGIERPILLGHSDGATIALMFAAAYAERTAACVALAPHVMVEDLTLGGIRDADTEPGATALRQRLAKYHGERTEGLWRAWAETWLAPGFAGCDMRAELADITAPTLAIQGADDAYGSPAQLDEIARRVSGPVETCLLADCGHAPHLECAEVVLAKIGAFVAAHF